MSRFGEKISRLKESESNEEKPTTTMTNSEVASSSSSASFNYRESSPIKEAILTKFARLAPTSLTSSSSTTATSSTPSTATSAEPEPIPGASSLSTEQQQQPTPSGPSWIHQVKGRIAKTVEEKVSEYRQERQEKELRRSVQNVRLFENERENGETDSDTFSSLPHSLSESLLIFDSTSNKFEEKDEFDTDSLATTTTPSSTPPQGATASSSATATTSRSEEHSPRERRRFTFPFRERSSKTSVVKNDESTNVTTPTNTPSTPGNGDSATGTSLASAATSNAESAPQPINSTPTKSSSLRLRVMGLMGKSPSATPGSASQRLEPAVSVNMTELRGSPLGEDPFSGVDLGICRSPSNEDFSTSPGSRYNRPNNLGIVPFGGTFAESEVETALEADEALTFDHVEDGGPDASELINDMDSSTMTPPNQTYIQRYLQHWWAICIPVCIILLIQILPIPYWMTGFITGLLVAVPSAIYGTLRFISSLDDTPRTTFVENVTRKKAKRSAIIVQEEIQSKVTWMNLWPLKKGPYDPLTYDVRKTSTVRVMLHGPWLELRFPRVNLPLRRMHDDTEPTKIDFHDRVEVIDLSTCSIELLPQNLPSKRVWSKKYPIQVRTNTRKPRSSPETSRKMAASSSTDDLQISPSSVNADEDSSKSSSRRSWSPDDDNEDAATNNFDEMMFDAKEDLSENETDKIDRKISSTTTTVRRRKNATTTTTSSNVATGCDKKISPTNSEKTEDVTSSFVVIPEEEANKTFYLFSRTSREKEEWFNRLLVAAKFMEDWEHQNPKDPLKVNPEYETQKVKQQKFNIFMEDYFQARTEEDAAKKHEEILSTPHLKQCAREQLAFFNIYAARLWHDLHDSRVFIDYLRDKLTRKLLKVKIAQYFNDVRVTTLDLGPQLPKVLSASLPWQDELGLWVNLEIEYVGLCQATVETQGIHWPAKDEPDREAQELALSRLAATMDSDEEDSAEEDDEGASPGNGADAGIFDDDDPGFEGLQPHAATGFRARMLDSLLRSEFVAKVAESEWVKKNITGKAITLQLQLHAIRGTLTVNFPPAPSDRVWYGFRTPPELEIALRPCFGGHPLGKYEGWLSTVMKHLEKRLKLEFMKVLVYPNLDDEVLPFMDHVVYSLNASTSILKQNSLSPQ